MFFTNCMYYLPTKLWDKTLEPLNWSIFFSHWQPFWLVTCFWNIYFQHHKIYGIEAFFFSSPYHFKTSIWRLFVLLKVLKIDLKTIIGFRYSIFTSETIFKLSKSQKSKSFSKASSKTHNMFNDININLSERQGKD